MADFRWMRVRSGAFTEKCGKELGRGEKVLDDLSVFLQLSKYEET